MDGWLVQMDPFLLGQSIEVGLTLENQWFKWFDIGKSSNYTPWKINGWNPTHHPFGQENDLNQTSMIMFQPLIFRSVEVDI